MQPVKSTKLQKRFRFSKERIEALPIPTDGPAVYYDTDVRGLCVRVQPSGRKLFFLLKKVAGKSQRRSLGMFSDMSVENARKHALGLLAAVADWKAGDRQDPNPLLRPLTDSEDTPLTFHGAFKRYLSSAGKKTKTITAENEEKANERRTYIFNHCYKDIQDKPVEEFTPTFVDTYHDKLKKAHKATMTNRAHEVLRAVFNFLIAKGEWTHINPATGWTREKRRMRRVILKEKQIKPFLDALDAEKNRSFAEWVALLLLTGARTGNAYAAEWDEFNLRRRTWTIPAEKAKNGEEMVLPLTMQAVTLLKNRAERLKIKELKGWVFPSESSASGHVEDFKNQWRRLMKAAGLCDEKGKPLLTRHDLRRSYVTNLIAAGVPLPVVAKASGHSNIVSLTPYAQQYDDDMFRAVERGAAEMTRRSEEAEAEKKAQGQKLLSA
jgi:integrase